MMPRKKDKKKQIKHEPYNHFKAFLVTHNIKLQAVADLFHCSVQNISMKNNGYAEYSFSEIEKICDHFGISSEIFRSSKVS